MGVLAGIVYMPMYRYGKKPGKYRSIRNKVLGISILGFCVLMPVAVIASITSGTEVQFLLWCYLAGLILSIVGFALVSHKKSSQSREPS